VETIIFFTGGEDTHSPAGMTMPFGILLIANLCLLYIWGSLALFLVHLQMDQLSLLIFFSVGWIWHKSCPNKTSWEDFHLA